MSKKCVAFSKSKLGLEKADNRKAFYAGWEAAILAEREACAKECDYWAKQAEERGYTCKGETHIDGFGDGAAACAAAIRARGNDAS